MGVKKQKRVRKSVRFYTACFGFREPYKILCDGTFVHHLLLHRIPHSQLSSLLGAPTKLFLTRCILAELKSLGESYSSSLHSARHLLTARCDHERRKSAAGCIEDVIGENNSEHFFVATQDADLRMKFREKPGIPLIYGLRNSLFLETPSEYQRQFVKSTEEERLHMNQSEFKMLKKRVASKAETDSSDANEGLGNEVVMKRDVTKTKKAKKVLGVVDKVKFKRKQAKGPNPLSCKKKKKNSNTPSAAQNPGGEAEVNGGKKRSRKRKRHQKARSENPMTNSTVAS